MSKLNEGDMVVLVSGSMRMAVESTDGDAVNVVWCHEGKIGRDSFNEKLLNKWEFREDSRGGDRSDRGPRGGFNNDRGDRGGRGGFNKDRGGRHDRDNDFGGRAERHGGDRGGKTGWDGRPRDRKHFRSDD